NDEARVDHQIEVKVIHHGKLQREEKRVRLAYFRQRPTRQPRLNQAGDRADKSLRNGQKGAESQMHQRITRPTLARSIKSAAEPEYRAREQTPDIPLHQLPPQRLGPVVTKTQNLAFHNQLRRGKNPE